MAVLARIRRYVPEVGGNRNLPQDQQIVALLKPISVYQKQVQLRKFLGMDAADLVKQMMKDEGSNEIKNIITKNVAGFENLFLEDDNGTQVSATIEDVWNMGEFELVMELFNNLLASSQLKVDEVKNSESPSGTLPTLH